MVKLVDKVAEEQERKQKHEQLLRIVESQIKGTALKVSAGYGCPCQSHITLYLELEARGPFSDSTRRVMKIDGLDYISMGVEDNNYLALARSIGESIEKELKTNEIDVRYRD